jgi:hypothetical protein
MMADLQKSQGNDRQETAETFPAFDFLSNPHRRGRNEQ